MSAMTSTLTFGSVEGLSGLAPTTMAEAEVRIRDLVAALTTRHMIEVARGMVMERERLTVESAFERLRRVSQNTNVRLASVATVLV
jgi:AmiR/NasT family two-component response regulator